MVMMDGVCPPASVSWCLDRAGRRASTLALQGRVCVDVAVECCRPRYGTSACLSVGVVTFLEALECRVDAGLETAGGGETEVHRRSETEG
jgi:hypothetical protein